MYFVKYNPLKEKLQARSVTDREALPYLVVFSALTALAGAFPMFSNFNRWDILSGAFSIILAIVGIFYAYKCNGGKEGFDLIQKYVVLGWVVAFRFLLIFIPLFIVVGIVEEAAGVYTEDTSLYDFLILLIFEVVLYQRIGRHIMDTRVGIANKSE